ncbi:hypothetical protein BV20DRAFT_420089 [Pilatotrama ljubarskyi]|nr:hypothetical protein BV20DRAFT_420089 [Pilatotrama ljubarskyi]
MRMYRAGHFRTSQRPAVLRWHLRDIRQQEREGGPSSHNPLIVFPSNQSRAFYSMPLLRPVACRLPKSAAAQLARDGRRRHRADTDRVGRHSAAETAMSCIAATLSCLRTFLASIVSLTLGPTVYTVLLAFHVADQAFCHQVLRALAAVPAPVWSLAEKWGVSKLSILRRLVLEGHYAPAALFALLLVQAVVQFTTASKPGEQTMWRLAFSVAAELTWTTLDVLAFSWLVGRLQAPLVLGS